MISGRRTSRTASALWSALFTLSLLAPSGSVAAAGRPAGTDGSAPVEAAPPPVRVGSGQPAVEDGDQTPRIVKLARSGRSFGGDVRNLPDEPPLTREEPDREEPPLNPAIYDPSGTGAGGTGDGTGGGSSTAAPAPATSGSFNGLDFASWGAGHPPDPNGDVGPVYYIQAVNTAVGIFDKATGAQVAAFQFNALMSQGNFGNLCDSANYGDPIVLYDTFEDRWILSDFAFGLDGSGNVVNPPGAFECFAVSKTGDPVAGGWNFYSVNTVGGLGDYPKLGVWTDGIYMSANMFGYATSSGYQNPRIYALNKAQMYAGASSVQVLEFQAPSAEFTLLPANARLQAGTPPAGSPELLVSTWQYLNALTVYKLHVDWDHPLLSTFTGPDVPIAATSWPNASVAFAPTPVVANPNDVLQIRAMMQAQYSNIAGAESLWVTHTVRRGSTSGAAAVRWYQVDVTGGAVAANLPQAATWDPDGNDTIHRYMPSLAVDRAGDLAVGYSASSATLNPAIRYAGRLAGDPVNTFSFGEQSLLEGTGAQSGTCGGSACERWGDYSAMTLDPDGCTFWYQNMYYATSGLDWQTRIGSFSYPSCTPVGSGGTLAGSVTSASGPVSGATVALGSRSTTTNGSGHYSFASLPAGTYPKLTVASPGLVGATATAIPVTDGGTTTRDFVLAAAPAGGCFTDTAQADFLGAAASTNCDLTSSPGSVTLSNAATVDQQNLTVTTSGFGFNSTSWAGQTFTPAVTGQITRVDLDLFCSGCTGTTPDLTVSIRATTGSPATPTGPDLAAATIAGFSSGAGGYFTADFASPATVTAGTTYAIVIRAVSNPSAGTYAYTCSCTSPNSNPYANGQRVTSANSGTTWTADATAGGRDLGFVVYMSSGYAASGTYESGTKDANPAPGVTPRWSVIAWDATTPAGTTVKFQAAGSNSPSGPFDFVGPGGSASAFFTTSGSSLGQFNGVRYLRYKAYLSTIDPAATPVLDDVTVCVQVSTSLVAAAASGIFQGTADLSATLTSGPSPIVGASIAFRVRSTAVGTATTNSSGVATLTGVSLAGIAAGTYPNGVAASYAGGGSFGASNGSATLTVATAPSLTTVTCPASVGYTGTAQEPCTAEATGIGMSPVDVSASLTYSANTGAGTATANATFAGDTNHAGSSGSATFAITPAASTTTVTCPVSVAYTGSTLTPCTARATGTGGLDQAVSVTYGSNASVGTATATATYAGDANHAGSSGSATFAITPAASTTTVTCPVSVAHTGSTLTPCAARATGTGGLDQAVAVTYSANVNAGTATANATFAGDTNHAGSSGSATFAIVDATSTTTVTLAPAAPNPTVQFGDPVGLTATVASPSGSATFSGTVTFSINGAVVGSAPVTNASPSATITVKLDATVIPLGAGSYPYRATFVPDPTANLGGSASSDQLVAVSREGQKADGTLDGSTLLDATDAAASLRTRPALVVRVLQSRAPEAADASFVDFGTVDVRVVYRVYRTACRATCPTAPVWTSAASRVAKASDWTRTGAGVASVLGPRTLAEGTYLVRVSVVGNPFVVAESSVGFLTVARTAGSFVRGGGFLRADAGANTTLAKGRFGFMVRHVRSAPAGTVGYAYRQRIDTVASTPTRLVPCGTLGGTCHDVDVLVRSMKITAVHWSGLRYPRTARVTGRARVEYVDAVTGAHYTALESAAATFRIDIRDAAASGWRNDRFGLTVYRADGSVLHAAYVPAARAIRQTGLNVATNQVVIGGGSIVVHPR